MSLKSFPAIQELSQTEIDILVQIYSNPTVKRHLQQMALLDTLDLLKLDAIAVSDSAIAKALATVRGKLAVIESLLSIGDTIVASNLNSKE